MLGLLGRIFRTEGPDAALRRYKAGLERDLERFARREALLTEVEALITEVEALTAKARGYAPREAFKVAPPAAPPEPKTYRAATITEAEVGVPDRYDNRAPAYLRGRVKAEPGTSGYGSSLQKMVDFGVPRRLVGKTVSPLREAIVVVMESRPEYWWSVRDLTAEIDKRWPGFCDRRDPASGLPWLSSPILRLRNAGYVAKQPGKHRYRLVAGMEIEKLEAHDAAESAGAGAAD